MAGLGKNAADRRVSHATKRVKRYVDSVPHSAPSLTQMAVWAPTDSSKALLLNFSCSGVVNSRAATCYFEA